MVFNYNISPLFPPSKLSHVCFLTHFRSIRDLFSHELSLRAHMYFIYTHIPKYNLLSPYNVTCVFSELTAWHWMAKWGIGDSLTLSPFLPCLLPGMEELGFRHMPWTHSSSESLRREDAPTPASSALTLLQSSCHAVFCLSASLSLHDINNFPINFLPPIICLSIPREPTFLSLSKREYN